MKTMKNWTLAALLCAAALPSVSQARDTTLGRTVARRQPKGDAVTLVRVAPPIDLTHERPAA